MKIYEQLKSYVNMREHENDEKPTMNAMELKILIVGDSSVGKSSICERFCMNEFSLEIKPSNQIECYPKMLKIFDTFVRIYLIDVQADKFDTLNPEILSNVRGAIIVYDITKTKTFENVEQWMDRLKAKFGISIPYMIIGNKNDLKFLRNVDEDEANEKAITLKCDFMEVSCIDTCEEDTNADKSNSVESVKESIKLLVSRIYYLSLPESEKEKVQSMVEEIKEDN